jgi:citrate lyase subunit beta/citryl-CoA lyase
MSERTRDLPRRSCHAVPGSNPRFVEKAQGLEVDMVFLDLEDSVAPKEKEGARAVVADAIKNGSWGDKVVCVRVNDWSTKWTTFDIIEVVTKAGDRLDEIMLPKVESAAQVVAADMILRQCEIAAGLPIGHIGIEAQIETARGLINVEEICAASPRMETIIFGPADFAASMEMPVLSGGTAIPEYPGDHFHYVFNKTLSPPRSPSALRWRPAAAATPPTRAPRPRARRPRRRRWSSGRRCSRSSSATRSSPAPRSPARSRRSARRRCARRSAAP